MTTRHGVVLCVRSLTSRRNELIRKCGRGYPVRVFCLRCSGGWTLTSISMPSTQRLFPEILCRRLFCFTLFEETQFRLLNPEFCEATIQTDEKLRKGPNGWFRQVAKSGKVDVDFAGKRSLVLRLAVNAGHIHLLVLPTHPAWLEFSDRNT